MLPRGHIAPPPLSSPPHPPSLRIHCPDNQLKSRLSKELRTMSDIATNKQDYFLYTGLERGDILRDVTHDRVHLSIRKIKGWAFNCCRQSLTVILHDGLEDIGSAALARCTSLVHMAIPPAIRAIKDYAFWGCLELRTAILNNWQVEIGEEAFTYNAHPSLLNAIVRAFLATKSFAVGSSMYPCQMPFVSKSVPKDVISLSDCHPQWPRSAVDLQGS